MSTDTENTFDYSCGTKGSEVIEFFESSFADKHVIPDSLLDTWLKRAIARYSLDIEPLIYDEELNQFSKKLNSSVIETLSLYIKKFYQERQLSLVNKRISIVGKDLSINSGMSSSKFVESELEKINIELGKLIHNQIPSVYS